MYKVGIGQDSHALSAEKKPLVMGGVTLNSTGGFHGNSDGDMIIHSICNALSSALGGDSIGTWSDKMCKEEGTTESTKYLERVFELMLNTGYGVNNIAISCEMKHPRLNQEQLGKIKKSISELLKVSVSVVGLTLHSGDGLTSFGLGRGAYVTTIIMLKKT